MTVMHRPSALHNFEDWIEQHQIGITSVTEMQEWLNKDSNIIVAWARKQDRSWSVGRAKVQLCFELEDVRYSSMVSNSQHAPRNGVTNWWRRQDLAMGYPGWQGRIHLTANRDYCGFASDLFSSLNIHVGNGGGSWQGSTYHIQWFAHDWPGMSMARSLTWCDDHT